MPDDPAEFPLSAEALDLRRVRDVLARAGYTEDGIPRAVGFPDLAAILGSDAQTLFARSSGDSPLHTLVRLVLIGLPVDAVAVRGALEPMTLEEWVAAGILRVEGDRVLARVRLMAYDGLILASDLPLITGSGVRPDYVMGLGITSLTLANLTVRRRCGTTLDLGTGSGVQAFLAARHSDRVMALDRNSRAVRFAAFNGGLNELPSVRCIQADLFAPFRGPGFDLIVSNPPFVISPGLEYLFRDSGRPADDLCRDIVRQAPALLRDGAFCQLLCHWAHVPGERWQERLAGWCEGVGCDAWVMRAETQDPSAYAATWILPTEGADPPRFARVFTEWMRYFERERIEAVSGGLITLRRAPGRRTWFRAEDGPVKIVGSAGEHVLRLFRAQDFLEAAGDAGLLRARLRVAPEVRLEEQRAPSTEGWRLLGARLRLTAGLGYAGTVDPPLADLVGRCAGDRSLGEILGETAAARGLDAAQVAAAALPAVRTLVERGFLLPEWG